MTSIIDHVDIHLIEFEVADLGLGGRAGAGVGNMVFAAGRQLKARRIAVRIRAKDGASGMYVTHWVGTPSTHGQMLMLAPNLLGRDAEQRALIYDDLKREARAYDHMGHGPLDIALWDLAGRKYGTSVSRMIGGYRTRLPVYASTYHGQDPQDGEGGLCSPQAFADYADACKERGFHGFKIHGWNDGDARREARNLRGVRERIGDDMALMIDPACQLRTWRDALYVGRACDEVGCLWYEDPYRDSGIAAHGHRMLREKLATPLLVSEHVRGPEQKANFVLAGGCDIVHVDPEYDLGLTGALKIAHFCEALGMDVQVHACGPAHRTLVSALRNTMLYEMALIGPGMANVVPPVYACGYADQPDALGDDGCVPVPQLAGIGVDYDWPTVERLSVEHHAFH